MQTLKEKIVTGLFFIIIFALVLVGSYGIMFVTDKVSTEYNSCYNK